MQLLQRVNLGFFLLQRRDAIARGSFIPTSALS
jgi:hypothetical protein